MIGRSAEQAIADAAVATHFGAPTNPGPRWPRNRETRAQYCGITRTKAARNAQRPEQIQPCASV